MSTVQEPLSIATQGVGVISGQEITVQVEAAPQGSGIVFWVAGELIPARLESVVHTDRGVTLASADGKVLSIVEHFLCAAALLNLSDLAVHVQGGSEMPILDGSAQDWITLLAPLTASVTPIVPIALQHAVFYRHHDNIAIYAIPSSHFQISYSVNFNHPDLTQRWARWDSQLDAPALISKACTFGYVSELPALHSRGLALGASLENSLGLFETGGYSRTLRHPDEPIYHKMLDLIGDLSLSGLNPLHLKAHVFALNAGHSSHIPFARQLRQAIQFT